VVLNAVTGDPEKVVTPLAAYHTVPAIGAFLLLLPLMLIPSSVIYEESWMDDSRLKRRVLCGLLIAQLFPVAGALYFVVKSMQEGQDPVLMFRVLVSTALFFVAAFVLKFGNVSKEKEDEV
jgi:hypothetical protein